MTSHHPIDENPQERLEHIAAESTVVQRTVKTSYIWVGALILAVLAIIGLVAFFGESAAAEIFRHYATKLFEMAIGT